jgi:NAD-dependent dihydropyrimidine dehydrogenase PreA subunit
MAHDLPREKIPWFPTIDYDACVRDRECLEFCKNNVYSWDDALDLPLIEHPYNCVVGCDACAQVCPAQAIHFPAKDELRQAIREARAALQHAPAGGS